MANAEFNNIKIGGMACAIPSKIVKSLDYAKDLGHDEVQKYINTTGIEARHRKSAKQTASDLCFVAAERLFEDKRIDRDSIDAIILVTQTSDYVVPATAYVLHKRLSLKKDCLAFDITLGCSGYVYGLYLASTILQTGDIERVLLLSGETWRDNPETSIRDSMFFGDAGSATLLERGNTDLKCLLRSDGEGYTASIVPGERMRNPLKNTSDYYKLTKLLVNEEKMHEFSTTEVSTAFKDFFDIYSENIGDYDYCILQQSNLSILNDIAKLINLPLEKMPISLNKYGNTRSASIPLSIVELCKDEGIPDNMKLISSGFGGGLSWGIASFNIKKEDVLPIVVTDDYYKDAFSIGME